MTNVFLDPDNAFWLISKRKGSDTFIDSRTLSFYNDLKNDLDSQMADFRFSAKLTAVYIDPTDRCNANCPYCYIPQKIRTGGSSMTERGLMFILEKLSVYFKKRKTRAVIVFHAAEPLLVKDIVFAAIEKFKNTFNFGLQTNATLLERPDVDFLKSRRVGIGISLDSFSNRINDRSRPMPAPLANDGVGGPELGGNFKKAVKAIEWFDGYDGLNVITTMTRFNIEGLPQLVRFLHKMNVSCVLMNPVRLTQKSSRNIKPDEALMAKYFIKAVDTAIALSKQSKNRIIIGNFSNTILGIVAPTARRLMCDISPCGGGRCFFTITAKGEMIPCGEFIGLKGFSGGNIFKESVNDALVSRQFRRIRARFVEKIPECKVCIYRNICGAPCPAELHSMGNMYQKSIFCEFYKEVISHAFRVIANKDEKYCFRQKGLDNLEYEYRL